ncbi:Bacteriophage HK97-gp10, putative tail-component [Halolactibacillus halophilus]|uniref:Bacteriophage HK97-gp10, putative tail-component n=1 Tax=Halolactibacillus halophilus TaxID=306540 RepID=A0A1I5ML69_9BACI|nr:HK97 gp10 family phage protein [Halolactibacillus halophilus]GEM02499.1 hypothetical protein HHA03_20310 [Halolactibacillus halophilus]SFP10344.1 Bacteriophage HK97-gp10, putative tail-component [Halolactibacillus halophilus]
MARKRKELTMESNLEHITKRIQEKPYKVMNLAGQQLVREIKPNVPKDKGDLRKSLGYWARKKEKDLQIGWYKDPKRGVFYSHILMGWEKDPIKPVVAKNAELIKQMIGEALDEIRKE